MISKGYRLQLVLSIISTIGIVLFIMWQFIGKDGLLLKAFYIFLGVLFLISQVYYLWAQSKFIPEFFQLTKKYQLTPEKLAEITGRSRYDFSYDKNGQLDLGYIGWSQRLKILKQIKEYDVETEKRQGQN